MNSPDTKPSSSSNEFARLGTEQRASFIGEYMHFLKTNKKWWMLPLALVLLGFGVLMVLSSTGAAPFIYTLF